MSKFIHDTAIVYENVHLPENYHIGPYCIVGSPCERLDYEPSKGMVVIGDGVILTKMVTVDSPSYEHAVTQIGDNSFLMAHSHFGHDSICGYNCVISAGAIVGGHNILENHVTLGTNSVTHQRATLREGTFIGSGAFFKGESQPWGTYINGNKFLKFNNYLRRKLGLSKI